MTMEKTKLPLLEAGKWLSLVLVLVFIGSLLVSGKESAAAFSDVESAVTGAAVLDNMFPGDHQMIKRLYGLEPGDYEGISLYYPTTNMGAEEILLVKLKSTAQQEAVKAAIDARLATQLSNFDGYGVSQCEMLERSVTLVQGNYILLVVAEDTAPVVSAFQGAL